MRKETGGPAYPVSYGPDGEPGYAEGMTLRDYFAGQAITGILASYANPSALSYPDEGEDARNAARDAYNLADAMMEAREARKS